jgi:hypothetical protein
MSKFIRQIFGSVHFKTRFLPFIENNKDTLHNYVYLVDNYELYEPYKDLLTILDIEEVRKDHSWSNNEIEIHFHESNPELYAKNFKTFYKEKNSLLPFCTMRFLLPYMYQNNILKFTYIGNNVFTTNKQEVIDQYFNSIPEGTFHILKWNDLLQPSIIYGHMGDLLKEKFSDLIFPENYCSCDGFGSGFSFKNKEHLQLFYEIFDYITYQYNTSTDPSFRRHFFQDNHGYTRIDDIIAYIIRIFEINFNYKIKYFLEYWDNQTLGYHVTTPHDAWYYALMLPQWNLNVPDENETIFTIEEYIRKNKEALINYYNNHLTHATYKITEDNQVIIKHKNI